MPKNNKEVIKYFEERAKEGALHVVKKLNSLFQPDELWIKYVEGVLRLRMLTELINEHDKEKGGILKTGTQIHITEMSEDMDSRSHAFALVTLDLFDHNMCVDMLLGLDTNRRASDHYYDKNGVEELYKHGTDIINGEK